MIETMPAARRSRFRPHLEALEDRCVLTVLPNPAAVPAPLDPAWLAQAARLAADRGNPAVLFLGDSIFARFARGRGEDIWRTEFAPLGAGDLAIGRSKTQNVLWLIDRGLLDGLAPKVVVLLIGTNNLNQGNSPAEVAGGVAADVGAIEARLPRARVLLLAILPRDEDPHARIRSLIEETNPLLAGVAVEYHTAFLDAGPALLDPGGGISPSVLGDGLHPTAEGYQILAGEIRPAVLELLAAGPGSHP
jgi:lysophospholipase L1-like esterase